MQNNEQRENKKVEVQKNKYCKSHGTYILIINENYLQYSIWKMIIKEYVQYISF